METVKMCDGLHISVADDMEYVIAYHKNESTTSGVAVKANGFNLMSLTVAMVISVLEKMRDPHIQASFFAAMFDTIKGEGVLNPIVDMAVSYDGQVLRNEEAAD